MSMNWLNSCLCCHKSSTNKNVLLYFFFFILCSIINTTYITVAILEENSSHLFMVISCDRVAPEKGSASLDIHNYKYPFTTGKLSHTTFHPLVYTL